MESQNWGCPLPLSSSDAVQLGHGSGGRMMQQLIHEVITSHFKDTEVLKLNDGAVIEINGQRWAFTTDSYVVDPIFFPGGDIGSLAVNGTVNDLAMCGATPLLLSVGLIIEEGLPLADLHRILDSMQKSAEKANVRIVTGDTKVVPHGKGDKIFINTTGLGVVNHRYVYSADNLKVGDKIILSGSLGEHGIAILSQREGLQFDVEIQSDTACVYPLVADLIKTCGEKIHALRDPTRGGLAAVLNEWSQASQVQIEIDESAIPIQPAVNNACELLGLDPLHIANEGKFIVAVAGEAANRALQTIKQSPQGSAAAIVGEVVSAPPQLVSLRTQIGGRRIIDMPMGELLPRIC